MLPLDPECFSRALILIFFEKVKDLLVHHFNNGHPGICSRNNISIKNMHKITSLAILLCISLNVHSQATDYVTGLYGPQDIVVDGNTLYIAESNASRIVKVDLSVPDPEPEVVISGIPQVYGLALKGTELYYSQLNGENRISKIDLSQPNPTPTVLLENFGSAHDLLFYGNDLYIAQFNQHKIVKLKTSVLNPSVEEVVDGITSPIAMELVGDDLYVATWVQNKVLKIDLSSSHPIAVEVIRGLSLPVGLVHRRNELYIAEAGQRIGEDRISKIDINSPNPRRETVVDGLYNPTKGLEIYEDVLYIAEDFKISSFGLPLLSVAHFKDNAISISPNPTPESVTISGLKRPVNYSIHGISGARIGGGRVANNERIPLQNLSAGTYILKMENGTVRKIIKE